MFALLKELFNINKTFAQLEQELDSQMAELPQLVLDESVVIAKDIAGETTANILEFLISA